MSETVSQHENQIISQFSKQAIPFAKLPGHLTATERLIELAHAHPDDTVLDVACGPGLVACAFAPHVKHVEGIDITTAMIEQAKKLQAEKALQNVSWTIGAAEPLPYKDDSFSTVISRYSFHHFLNPQRILREMVRVCRSGGRILVADVVQPIEKAAAYDQMEKLRDPSHTHALVSGQMDRWFCDFGLTECSRSSYTVDVELEAQLKASFPNPGDTARLRQLIIDDIGKDSLGINAHKQNNSVVFSYPISVFTGRKPF